MICLKLDSYTKSHIHKFKYTVDTVFFYQFLETGTLDI